MALNWHLAPFWKASSFATNNSTMKKIAFLSLGQLRSKSVSQGTDPATLVQRHVSNVVSPPAAACGMYSHPRDPGALWRKNSRLPHWVLHSWVTEIQSCCWRPISKWFSLLPSTKAIVCDIWFWTFTLHICNFSSYFQTVTDIKTAIKM